MLGEVLIILLLTILFTISTIAAMLLRHHVHGGFGQIMYMIWLTVMLTALIPLQIAPPIVSFIVSERTVTEVQPPYRDMHPEILLITGASHEIRRGDLPVLRAHLSETDEPVITGDGETVAFNISGVMIAGFRFILFIWAAGMSYRLIRELMEYRDIKRFLHENSDPCTDSRILALFDACREQIGLQRYVPLRCIRDCCPMTPCVIGFFRSTVYLSAFCDDMDSSHLANIFTHELCHVKRRDMLYKLLMVLTTSVHWFNPISVVFRSAVTEDLEMACDATVLRYQSATAVRDYMESILTVAERLRRERKACYGQYEPMFRAAFFMANDTTPSYLKRRYQHMKTTREKKNRKTVYTLCAGVLALICAANVAVLSSCSYVRATDETYGATAAGEDAYLCDPVEVAFANYFCVPDYADITDAQFAQIESVDVFLVKPQDGTPKSVYISIDGGAVEMLSPCILKLDMFENSILPKIDAWEESKGDANLNGKKFRAFYCVKNPGDPTLEPREVAEMQSLFPITKETAVALYDPYTTEREDAIIYSYLYDAGLVNRAAFSETALEAKLNSISALAGADITVTAAETIAGFAQDTDLFENRSPMYAAYMSEYMNLRQKEAAATDALVLEELSTQIDINGNGIIGE